MQGFRPLVRTLLLLAVVPPLITRSSSTIAISWQQPAQAVEPRVPAFVIRILNASYSVPAASVTGNGT